MNGRSLGSNMYGPNITKTGVHSPPEAIYILGKDNILFCFKRRRYGKFDSYYNTNLILPLLLSMSELKTKMKRLIIVDYFFRGNLLIFL